MRHPGSDGNADVQICFESRLEHIGLAGTAINAMCIARGADPETAGAVELALVEVATNTVEHAYHGVPHGLVRIRVRFADGRVDVEVSDAGDALPLERLAMAELPPINPDAVDDLPEGGFGLALVCMIADSVEASTEEGWNFFRFSRKLARRETPMQEPG